MMTGLLNCAFISARSLLRQTQGAYCALKMRQSRAAFTRGFTLVEMLVVAGIFAVVAIVSYYNFQLAQLKTRDLQRKTDVKAIAEALGKYLSDFGVYPEAEMGKIVGCGAPSYVDACQWGSGQFGEPEGTIYLSRVPGDLLPERSSYYYEVNETLTSFRILASLENTRDPEANNDINEYLCGGGQGGQANKLECNFGVASHGQNVLEWK